MTNYEYLCSLSSIEEINEELSKLPICAICKYVNSPKECHHAKNCSKPTTEWLKSERETG